MRIGYPVRCLRGYEGVRNSTAREYVRHWIA